ncbi:MAG: AAA family ATPase [bacterium]|nr:AAA family ATPase [bacterium]
MISKMSLKFGSDPDSSALEFSPGPVTIFVGPNNSGKSLVLRECENLCVGKGEGERLILDKCEFDWPKPDEARRLLDSRKTEPDRHERLQSGEMMVWGAQPGEERFAKQRIHVEKVVRLLTENRHEISLFRNFLSLFTIRLDGRTRFALTLRRESGNLKGAPQNHIMALFMNDEARERVSNITYDAFDRYLVIDPTEMTHFGFRLSARKPSEVREEQALDARARDFHSAALDIAQASDGVKAFVGLLTAVMSAEYRIMLIDEPEAFLHPTLVRKLGRQLSELVSERQGNILASTHSADFLMGCIQSGKRVNVVRLTYQSQVATARILPSESLQPMMRDPLLRSTNVLSALFHSGAVVCEGDTDRAFYQEINERLLHAEPNAGARDTVFLNAQNKQTLTRIAKPLRQMGIPAAMIVDLDGIESGQGYDFEQFLRDCFVPDARVGSLSKLRQDVRKAFTERSLKPKVTGINALSNGEQETARSLLAQLGEFGIFVVPCGELEKWMPLLAVSGHGPQWLVEIFTKMGDDPLSPNYLRPQANDVWQFIEGVAAWIANPKRTGMPPGAAQSNL